MADIIPIASPPSIPVIDLRSLAKSLLKSIENIHTRENYGRHIKRFLHGKYPLTRDGVFDYLRDRNLGSSSRHLALNALRKLTREAESAGLITSQEAWAISKIKTGAKTRVRIGRWLTLDGVRQLLTLPDRSTYIGRRDAALLALLLGCGLRREEAVEIPWSCYQERDGRMILADFEGKGKKLRSVPVPEWARKELDLWREAVEIYERKNPQVPSSYNITRARADKITFHDSAPGPGARDADLDVHIVERARARGDSLFLHGELDEPADLDPSKMANREEFYSYSARARAISSPVDDSKPVIENLPILAPRSSGGETIVDGLGYEKITHKNNSGPKIASERILRGFRGADIRHIRSRKDFDLGPSERLYMSPKPMHHNTVFAIITHYSDLLGVKFSPHDLRRTLAKLMRDAGADLEQIQLTLGHESLKTTERYLGGKIELRPKMAGVDKIEL
jgi:integrase